MEQNINQELLDTIDAYIKGQLKGGALDKFTAQLNSSPELREEVNIQKQLFSALNDSDLSWNISERENSTVENKIDKGDYRLMSEKIHRVAKAHKDKDVKNVIPLWKRLKKYGYAAAIVAILLVSFSLFKNMSSKNAYQYNHTQWAAELTSFNEKGNDLSPFNKAEAEFKSQKYKSAIDLFNTINSDSKYYPYSLMYIGASHELLDENEKALKAFDKLINLTDFEDHSKGLWFKAQVYLNAGQKSQAISELEEIVKDENNAYFNEALKLLKALK